jgi:hypothetical protein
MLNMNMPSVANITINVFTLDLPSAYQLFCFLKH